MTTYRIEIDRDLCNGFGICTEVSAEFRVEGDKAVAVSAETDADSVLEAAKQCPMGAITVFDAVSGDEV